MYYKLEKPNVPSAVMDGALQEFRAPSPAMRELIRWSEDPHYRYWDTLRHKATALDLSPEQAWMVVKLSRNVVSRTYETPARTEKGDHFAWHGLSRFDAFFHEIDMGLGGTLKLHGIDLDLKYRQEFITRGVMEEAIASAQLEGANTARKVARRILLEGRRPGTRSERMIVNNYEGMRAVEQEHRDAPLSLDVLLRLHEILTKDTLDNPKDVGRIRTGTDDDVDVVDIKGTIYHTGPDAQFVRKELDRLIAYANNTETTATFTHPVARAIILHFWLAYLHPFADGNGRLARLLFYWSLLRDGYWGFTYLPISRVIKEAHTAYGMAFVYSEQDDFDLTYFLDFNVRKIQQALRDFKAYVAKRSSEQVEVRHALRNTHGLNERQMRTLQYLHANAEEYISTASYQQVNAISGPTAASDVKKLVSLGFLKSQRRGHFIRYYATPKLATAFKA
jgi:Fic family protein